MIVYALILILVSAATLALLYPQDALAVVAELRRQLRLRLIRRSGAEGAKQLSQALHEYAAKTGIEAELVDYVLAEHHDMIVERVGRHYADEILGEPDPTERYF
jgi:hypothetical protein